ELSERIVDFVKLDVGAPEHEVLAATIATMREKDAETDRERVAALFGDYRASGLACIGLEPTRRALERGQVDELLIADGSVGERFTEELVKQARQTAAKVRFIEDRALLDPVGGVGAFLRYVLEGSAR